jgi:gamma-glutamyltranspeptidase / glutathione hydrolase
VSDVNSESRRGVIAAGHEQTARAGAEVLAAGGNAVDAAIAASFAASVAEPTLTALGGGGFMLVSAPPADPVVLDFFVAMPGFGAGRFERSRLTPTPVDFGSTVQMFHGGHASVGLPGFVAGMFEAHRRYASMPLGELVGPAKRLAVEGVEQTTQQAYLNTLLHGVNTLTPESERLFSRNGNPLRAGEKFLVPDIVTTLDALVRDGQGLLYGGGELGARLVATVLGNGGSIDAEDLARYAVIERKPLAFEYRGREVYSNPPPATGGSLMTAILDSLKQADLRGMEFHGPAHLEVLAAAIQAMVRSRSRGKLGNTTHISVMDASGMAASVTSSNGTGSGVVVPGSGIVLNNMLGEEDLNPSGSVIPAGERLQSMMTPAIALSGGKPELVVGSAGSNRICSAVAQVLSAVLDFGLDIAAAVDAPRVHLEQSAIELEGGIPEASALALEVAGYEVNRWPGQNLYFGGLQAAAWDGERFSGRGDSRRGGFAVVV